MIRYLLAIITLFSPGLATAGFDVTILATTSAQKDGSTLYSYKITNVSDSTLNVQSFDLNVSSSANITNIYSPSGWTALYSTGDTDLLWSAGPDENVVLTPGTTGLFSFTSVLHPKMQNYDIFGIDYDGINYDDNLGTTASPTAVPEPISMIPLGIGMVTLAGYSIYRSKRER